MNDVVSLGERLSRELEDSQVRLNHPLAPLTTYKVGGPAAVHVLVDSRSDLDVLAAVTAEMPCAVLVLGRGSNLLIADDGFAGLVVQLGEAFASATANGTSLHAGAAAALPVLARRSVNDGLTGFEWAVGVPGALGGAVRMNAGGHGSDMAANLVSVDIVDLVSGHSGTRQATDLDLQYRSSSVAASEVVVRAHLELAEGDPAQGKAELTEIVRWRREHQPGGQNAGSVFANPEGHSAGQLIDQCGLKGHRIGSAEVSPKHANFIQADPGGRAADVLAVMSLVARRVFEQTGIELRRENKLVGFSEADHDQTMNEGDK